MVHVGSKPTSAGKQEAELSPPSYDNMEQVERIEDLLEEVEDCDDLMMEVDDDSLERPDDIDVESDRNADQAPSDLSKTKGNFFSCDKCNYVTHIRARFTKHVKYHSMPMIKCTMCDFRTPYKWNLDRHMKNHGGSGSFNCSMCNFTADIKQSLTVHEMNHHTPLAGQSLSSRRRNRVGASDTVIAELDAASALLPKEEEGSGDSRSSHSVSVSRCRVCMLCAWRGAVPGCRRRRLAGSTVTSHGCHCYHERCRTWIALDISLLATFCIMFTFMHVSVTLAFLFHAWTQQ